MAWRCSGSSNAGLVANMWTNGLISDPLVKEAFLKASSAIQFEGCGNTRSRQSEKIASRYHRL